MCRWFAYISPTEECLLEDVLVTPSHSLCKQVHSNYLPGLLPSGPDVNQEELEALARNRYMNIDGFGVGYYKFTRSEFTPSKGPHPALYRSAQPLLRDENFRSLARNTSTLALFAHIRASTASPVVSVNNHPFAFGRHLIMHNGTIEESDVIARALCDRMHHDAFAAMSGRTDSEHFAALYMTYLGRNTKGNGGEGAKAWKETYTADEMRSALEQAANDVFRLQQEMLKDQAPANSLNVCVTDGETMVAMRLRNHKKEQPPSLYYSTTAGVSLNRKYPGTAEGKENKLWNKDAEWTKNAADHGKHLIVASEPSTYVPQIPTEDGEGDWKLIPKNHCVMGDKAHGIRVQKLGYDEKLDSTVVTTLTDVKAHIKEPHAGPHDLEVDLDS